MNHRQPTNASVRTLIAYLASLNAERETAKPIGAGEIEILSALTEYPRAARILSSVEL